MASRPVITRIALTLLLVAVGASCSGGETADAPPVDPLVGEWVRINPPSVIPDTLELRADGRASGDGDGVEEGLGPLARWRIGVEVMPDGFCVAETSRWHCQAYLIRNDTLSLANGRASRYVRVHR